MRNSRNSECSNTVSLQQPRLQDTVAQVISCNFQQETCSGSRKLGSSPLPDPNQAKINAHGGGGVIPQPDPSPIPVGTSSQVCRQRQEKKEIFLFSDGALSPSKECFAPPPLPPPSQHTCQSGAFLSGMISRMCSCRNFLCVKSGRKETKLTTSLAGLCLGWIKIDGAPIFHTPGWCQTVIYLTYVTSFLSSWFVVSFTVER